MKIITHSQTHTVANNKHNTTSTTHFNFTKFQALLFILSIFITTTAFALPPQFINIGTQPAPGGAWDILPDGRILALNNNDFLMETDPASGSYNIVATLPAGLISPFGPSFLTISPDGSRFLIGDNNFDGAFVYLINTADLDGSEVTPQSFPHENFQAAWMNNFQIAITYGNPQTFLGEVAILNVDTAIDTIIITINGASAGIAFDEENNLLTGNGFDFVQGGSETGDIHAFTSNDIQAVLDNQSNAIDFDNAGNFVMNALSASALAFDANANLFVGGWRTDENNFFAIAEAAAVNDAIDGLNPVAPDARFTDDPVANPDTIYNAHFNPITDNWLVDGGDNLLYHYSQSFCLDLTLDQLQANALTTFTITKGTPGSRLLLAFGLERGISLADNFFGYCASAGIRGINRNRTLGGFNHTFDQTGTAQITQFIPANAAGRTLLFQAIENATCPEQCISQVWKQTVNP